MRRLCHHHGPHEGPVCVVVVGVCPAGEGEEARRARAEVAARGLAESLYFFPRLAAAPFAISRRMLTISTGAAENSSVTESKPSEGSATGAPFM